MIILEWLRFLVGSSMILIGLAIFGLELVGFLRYKYVMNRMHAAALGDTMGIGSFTLGIMVLNGFNITSFKMLAVVAFLWFTSPVSSHLIAKMEISVDKEPQKHYGRIDLTKNKNEKSPQGEAKAEDAAGLGDKE